MSYQSYKIPKDRNPYTNNSFLYFIFKKDQPRIKVIKGEITSAQRPIFMDNKMNFFVASHQETVVEIKIYTEEFGKPELLSINGNLLNVSDYYYNSTKMLTISYYNQPFARINVVWKNITSSTTATPSSSGTTLTPTSSGTPSVTRSPLQSSARHHTQHHMSSSPS